MHRNGALYTFSSLRPIVVCGPGGLGKLSHKTCLATNELSARSVLLLCLQIMAVSFPLLRRWSRTEQSEPSNPAGKIGIAHAVPSLFIIILLFSSDRKKSVLYRPSKTTYPTPPFCTPHQACKGHTYPSCCYQRTAWSPCETRSLIWSPHLIPPHHIASILLHWLLTKNRTNIRSNGIDSKESEGHVLVHHR